MAENPAFLAVDPQRAAACREKFARSKEEQERDVALFREVTVLCLGAHGEYDCRWKPPVG